MSVLSGEGIQALFAAVAKGDVLGVIPEVGPRQTVTSMELQEACQALLALRLRGVHLHYRVGGREWWDTIRTSSRGFEVVHSAA